MKKFVPPKNYMHKTSAFQKAISKHHALSRVQGNASNNFLTWLYRKSLFILIVGEVQRLMNIHTQFTLPLSLWILFLSFSIRAIKYCLRHNERCCN